jgi:hypothetical protein
MEPDNGGGLGSSGGALVMALVVAAVALLMINIGGGVMRPLVTHSPRVAMTQPARSQG